MAHYAFLPMVLTLAVIVATQADPTAAEQRGRIDSPGQGRASCPITVPSDPPFTPPSPYPSKAPS
jgi:hypothetical protein